MTVELSPELEAIIQKQIASGRYHSASEVLQDALSLLNENREKQTLRLERLNEKIDQGLESLNMGHGVDGELFFEELRQKEKQLKPSDQ